MVIIKSNDCMVWIIALTLIEFSLRILLILIGKEKGLKWAVSFLGISSKSGKSPCEHVSIKRTFFKVITYTVGPTGSITYKEKFSLILVLEKVIEISV